MMLLKILANLAVQKTSLVTSAWNRFWFAPTDPLPLCVLRLLAGGMLLYTHIIWGVNLEAFFGSEGWHSVEAVTQFQENQFTHSIWWLVPDEWLRFAHTAMGVVLLLFFLGVATPVTSVLALVITISNSNRAPIANYGLDQILSLFILYLAIGPSGAYLSVDRLIKKFRTQLKRVEVKKSSRANLSLRLIQVHYCVIYFFAGTAKLQGDAWWNGQAMWMTFANEEYQSLDMTWLAHYPRFTEIMTHVTVIWELAFAFVIWNKSVRPFMLLIGAFMHLGIVFALGMPTFGLIMIFGYTAFLSPDFLVRVTNLFSKREKIESKPDKKNVEPTKEFEDSLYFSLADRKKIEDETSD